MSLRRAWSVFMAVVVVAVCSRVRAEDPQGDIQVPPGFTARRIAPLLDGVRPQLEAIDTPTFGTGVITVGANNGIITIRLVEPSGVILPIATLTESAPNIGVTRVRHDRSGSFEGALLLSIRFLPDPSGPDTGTVFSTIDPEGGVIERFRSASAAEGEWYDFEITGQLPDDPIAVVLLDANSHGGTRLASFSSSFDFTIHNGNSFPPGRDDTDVVGLQFDVSGAYGSDLILADSDCNGKPPRSTIWSLSGVLAGGVYSAVSDAVPCTVRRYGDLAIAADGPFGGIAYVTETLTDEIQQVDPNGLHTTWASGFVGIDSLSISPDGSSMYVGDLNGVWLIREEGSEPGPVVLCQDPAAPTGSPLTGDPVNSLRLIFNEPVSSVDADVLITNGAGEPVQFDASGSGSQFMIIGLAEPLFGDTYTITVADSVTSVATGQPLDGDNDGVAGGAAVLTLTHRCDTDIDGNGETGLADLSILLTAFGAACTP